MKIELAALCLKIVCFSLNLERAPSIVHYCSFGHCNKIIHANRHFHLTISYFTFVIDLAGLYQIFLMDAASSNTLIKRFSVCGETRNNSLPLPTRGLTEAFDIIVSTILKQAV